MDTESMRQTIRTALTRKQRHVCAAYWFDNLPQVEIGRLFGMRQSRVSEMIRRAKARLQNRGIEPPTRPVFRHVQRPLHQLSAVETESHGGFPNG